MGSINSAAIIVLIVMASGLYAQERDTSQAKPEIKLELIWEGKIPEGVKDVIFLDEKGYNVFSVQCENPEKALKEKRILMVVGNKLRYYEGEEMKLVREVELRGGHITISKNGRNIVAIEGLERDTMGKGGYMDKPAVLRLYRWNGEELGEVEISPEGWEYIDLYPLGNDQTVLMHLAGGEGLYNGIEVLVRHGERLEEEITDLEGSWVVDYAESGERALVVLRNRYMVVIDGEGREESRYICPRPFRGGYLSPRGSYIVEVTAGKYVMIYDRGGRLIAEHHVQGPGNYYAAFSPDEKYLCVTPGFRKIYFFETQTGKLIWEYTYPDDRPSFFPGDVAPEGEFTFMVFTPSKDESKWIWVFDGGGEVVGKLGPLDFSGYSLPVRYVGQVQQLFVRLPSRMFLYRLVKIRGE